MGGVGTPAVNYKYPTTTDMETSELIKSFGTKIGIPLEPNDDGIYYFDADGLLISIIELPELDSIALDGDLGEPPPEGLEALYKAMLEANHLFHETNGATFSRNPENGRFELCKILSSRLMDTDSFYAEVERFVNLQEAWAKIIKNYRDTEHNESAPELDTSGFMQV